MRTSRVILGLFFLSIGVGFLLDSLGLVNFDWGMIWRLWPLIFIIWGIGALTGGASGFWISFLGVAVLIIMICAIVGNNFINSNVSWNSNMHEQHASLDYSSSITNAVLNVKDGAGTFILKDTTSGTKLIDLDVKTNMNGDYKLSEVRTDSGSKIMVERANTNNFHFGGWKSEVTFLLNTNPIWEMNFDIGAATANLDLSEYKVSKVNVNTGASSIDLKMGNKVDSSEVNVSAGASSINLKVPSGVGVKLHTKTGVSSQNISGFVKRDDGFYYSENYESLTKKMVVNFETGVTSIDVSRY